MSLSPLFQQKTTKNYQNFLPKDSEVSNFVGVIRLFVLVYSSADDNAKRYKTRRYQLRESIVKNYNVTINGKNFYDQSINSDVKQYKKVRKLAIGRGKDYTILSKQKELNADPKAMQEIEFVE